MTTSDKLTVYMVSVITVFTCLPMYIFDGEFESVMVWTWPFIFLGAGFGVGSVWLYEKIFGEIKEGKK